MRTKNCIRKQAAGVRDSLAPDLIARWSSTICRSAAALSDFKEIETLLTYVSFGSEVRTAELIEIAWKAGKKVYSPRVAEGGRMDFFLIRDWQDLKKGYRGIKEPYKPSECYAGGRAFMVLPGLAFDESRNRIGYGKGYYDRYLEGREEIVTAAVCFECQLLENIPAAAHDCRPDLLITEQRIIDGRLADGIIKNGPKGGGCEIPPSEPECGTAE